MVTVLDEMDDVVGQMGKFQFFLFIASSFCEVLLGSLSVFTVFGAARPDYKCMTCLDSSQPFNYSSAQQSSFFCTDLDKCGEPALDKCRVATGSYPAEGENPSLYDCCAQENTTFCGNGLFPDQSCEASSFACDKWVFDDEIYDETIVTEFGLVCDRSWIADLSTSLYYVGFGIGGIVGGILSDKYGRKIVLIFGNIFLMAVTIANAYSPTVWVYTAIRFLTGFLVNVCIVSSITYLIEILGAKVRSEIVVASVGFFALGELFLAYPFGYLLRNWRDLQFWLSVEIIPAIIMVFFMPKSYKWLIARNNLEEAKLTAMEIAEKNKGRELTEAEGDAIRLGVRYMADAGKEDAVKTASLGDLFKTKHLLKYTLILELNWFTNSIVYYGLGLNTGNLPGASPYTTTAASAGFELISYIIGPIAMRHAWWGRRRTAAYWLVLGGVACGLSTLFIELDSCGEEGTLTLLGRISSYIGKMFVSATFAIAYGISCEIYPAEIRGTALALNSAGARVAGTLSPWILALQDVVSWLPGVTFAVLGIVTGFCVLMLPETLGQPLMTTIQEAEQFYERKERGADDASSKGGDNEAYQADSEKQ